MLLADMPSIVLNRSCVRISPHDQVHGFLALTESIELPEQSYSPADCAVQASKKHRISTKASMESLHNSVGLISLSGLPSALYCLLPVETSLSLVLWTAGIYDTSILLPFLWLPLS